MNEFEYRAARAEQITKHYSSLMQGVYLPLVQAGLTSFLIALAAGLTASLFEYPVLKAFGMAFIYSLLGLWLILLLRWLKLTEALERLTGLDINRDGSIGEAEAIESRPQVFSTRLELVSDAGRRIQYLDIPIESERLALFAQEVLKGASLTEASFTGSNKMFTRSEFTSLRDALLRRGLISWNSAGYPARGVHLTRAGRAALEHLSTLHHSPTEADVYSQ